MVIGGILAITHRLAGVIDPECFAADPAIKGPQGFNSTVFRVDECAQVTVSVLAIACHLVGTINGTSRIHLAAQRPDIDRGPATLRIEKRLIVVPLDIVPDDVPVIVQAESGTIVARRSRQADYLVSVLS